STGVAGPGAPPHAVGVRRDRVSGARGGVGVAGTAPGAGRRARACVPAREHPVQRGYPGPSGRDGGYRARPSQDQILWNGVGQFNKRRYVSVVAHPVRDIALLGVDLALAVDPGVAGIKLGDRQVEVRPVQAVRHYSDSVRTFAVIAPDLSHHIIVIPRLASGVAPVDPVPAELRLHAEHRRGRGWNRDADVEVDLLNVREGVTPPDGGANREGGGVGVVIEPGIYLDRLGRGAGTASAENFPCATRYRYGPVPGGKPVIARRTEVEGRPVGVGDR